MNEPRPGWLRRLSDGLSRTSRQMSEQVVGVLGARPLDQDRLDALEEMLIEADLGPKAARRITEAFGAQRFGKSSTDEQVKEALAEAVAEELISRQGRFEPLAGPRPFVVLFIGVNGSGKTTTLGKIAHDLSRRGATVLIAACDTFRAAAVEQLAVWAERSSADFVSAPPGADAAGLAFDAFARAKAEGYDVLLIDTAGRLQNKQGLMDELTKMIRVVRKLDPDAPHEVLLVLDATVGRNALAQENIFGNAIGVTGIVMTKLDGTARGGVLVPVAQASDSPIMLIGVGEGIEDLQPFEARAFSRSLVGLEDPVPWLTSARVAPRRLGRGRSARHRLHRHLSRHARLPPVDRGADCRRRGRPGRELFIVERRFRPVAHGDRRAGRGLRRRIAAAARSRDHQDEDDDRRWPPGRPYCSSAWRLKKQSAEADPGGDLQALQRRGLGDAGHPLWRLLVGLRGRQ